jgi:Ca2+-binding RTX toxin-like protein
MGVYYGDAGANTLTGEGADVLYGLGGDDIIAAGAGDDVLVGGAGNDTLTGGTGKDVFVFDSYRFDRDIITDFVVGTDRLDLSALGIADVDALRPYLGQIGNDVVLSIAIAGDVQSITLQNVKLASLLASPASFVFNSLPDQVIWEGTAARDVLFGGKGADVLRGYNGNDDLSGGTGDDILDGGFGDDTLRGGGGRDRFSFTSRQFGSDTIRDFTLGSDRIDLRGLGIGDITSLRPYIGQRGNDVVIETAFAGEREAITITNMTVASLLAQRNTFIFNAETTPQVINGTAGSDVLFGGRGADILFGGNGGDDLGGGRGDDILRGGAGSDSLRGGSGNDRFVFDGRQFGNDTIVDFALGKDRIDLPNLGMADIKDLQPFMNQVGGDVVIKTLYAGEQESITIRGTTVAKLAAVPDSFVFNSAGDRLLVTGTSGVDTLFGGNANDTLFGYAGFDTLVGGAGNDILIGGAGDDTLRGGLGADRFVLGFGDGYDTIADFSRAQGDRIDLRSIDPDAAYGDQKLKLVTGDFTAAGQVRLFTRGGVTTIFVNLDDNLKTDEVAIDVRADAGLTAADILL